MAVTFPTSPTNGQQLTANGKTYTYSSASGTWNITGADNPIDILFTRSEFVATANQTTFSVTYNTDYPIEVFVNGLQYLASDYTATNGTSVVFNTGLPADAEVVIMYATSSSIAIPTDVSDLTDTTNIIPVDISDLTDTTDALSSGGGLTVYNTIDDIPSSADAGSLAFINENQRLLVYANSQWVSVELSNAKPVISGNNASYDLAEDGTATVVTLSAVDAEGADITWSYTTSGLGSIATVSQNVNVFTITPSTNTANSGTFSITFRASDGDTLGTSTSEFTLDLFVPTYYPNQNEGFFVDFTDENVLFFDTAATIPATAVGQDLGAVKQQVDFGGSASYLISDPAGDSDGNYTNSTPTLGNDGTRPFADIGFNQAFRVPSVPGDFANFIFCISLRNLTKNNTNARMFTMEGAGITGDLQIGISGSEQLFCRVGGTANNFSIDSINSVTENSSTPSVITVVVQNGVPTFRENGIDLGNSGSGGPTAGASRGCVLGGGYQDSNYNTAHDTYGAAFAYGTFTTADIEAFENQLGALAGITI